jgi:hypothetical protein
MRAAAEQELAGSGGGICQALWHVAIYQEDFLLTMTAVRASLAG